MNKPTDAEWGLIQASVDHDCPMSIVAALGRGTVSWSEAAERIEAYATAAFDVGTKRSSGDQER